MWREIFRLAGAVELGLVASAQCFPSLALPIGGGHVEQIAILFTCAFVLLEGAEVVRSVWKGIS
ncbi:hypothetical protein PSQ20_15365 [Curvibacter sp. RS43]|uniref:hypothetical protein n=1 Tax=Curvibacter microcysteis TaxID=3026419 RepID=UPI002362BC5A|nr:hypothetical protein [Curvibacter sp. RS43]MDD0811732.1 hypothetical protein [Curvibacter sp. RS43]